MIARAADASARRAVTRLVAFLLRATNRQARRLDELTARVAALEAQLARLDGPARRAEDGS